MRTFRQIAEAMNGTCYVDAYEYFNENLSNSKLRLVHGLVTGQGEISGILYGHAWCEDEKNVIDPSQRPVLTMKKEVYYALGNIEKKNVFSYDMSEMLEKVMEYETYGPWEKKLIKNRN